MLSGFLFQLLWWCCFLFVIRSILTSLHFMFLICSTSLLRCTVGFNIHLYHIKLNCLKLEFILCHILRQTSQIRSIALKMTVPLFLWWIWGCSLIPHEEWFSWFLLIQSKKCPVGLTSWNYFVIMRINMVPVICRVKHVCVWLKGGVSNGLVGTEIMGLETSPPLLMFRDIMLVALAFAGLRRQHSSPDVSSL